MTFRCVTPILGCLLVLVAPLAASGQDGPRENVEFRACDLWIDAGDEQLAAYQVEITYDADSIQIVGLEGGRAEGFHDAPRYDRAGFRSGRIIVAAFTLDEHTAPKGRANVARLHVALQDGADPAFSVRVQTAANVAGERIAATCAIEIEDKGE